MWVVRAGEQVGDVADAEFVEVDGAFAALDAEEDAEHFLQEGAGEDEVRHVVLGDGGAFAGKGPANGDGEEAVGDGLGEHVGEAVVVEVVDNPTFATDGGRFPPRAVLSGFRGVGMGQVCPTSPRLFYIWVIFGGG
jgi:hypothetical protein